MRSLVLDIETAPLLAYTFDLHDQNIGINQIVDSGGMLSFAAQWVGERSIQFAGAWERGERDLVRKAGALLDEADVVIGWNSQRFDVRWIQSQLARFGRKRVSPYANVDLMRSAKRAWKLPSYKLDYVAQFLGVGRKVRTGGFELWRDVLAGDKAAQVHMRTYNIGDVRITKAVYDRMLAGGWVYGLPNAAIEGGHVCPACGSEKLQARGHAMSATLRYKRWQCTACGAWSRSVDCDPGRAKLRSVA